MITISDFDLDEEKFTNDLFYSPLGVGLVCALGKKLPRKGSWCYQFNSSLH